MRVADMDWRMVEDWVRHDDRCAVPLGSTEQHAGLSLATDAILAERVAAEAAEPLGIPVFPALPYGLTPYFTAFPGTVTLRVATYAAVLRDVLVPALDGVVVLREPALPANGCNFGHQAALAGL